MRKKFISLLLTLVILPLFLNSCNVEDNRPKDPQSKPPTSELKLDNTSQYYDQNYKVYTLEGCEYIVVGIGQTRWGSHKGNCKNIIHYR